MNYSITSCDECWKKFLVHVNRLKPYFDPADQPRRVMEPVHPEENDPITSDIEPEDDLPLAQWRHLHQDEDDTNILDNS